MLEMRQSDAGSWNPQVMKTEAQRGVGIDELTNEILAHRDFFLSSGTIDVFLRERNQRHFMSILRDTLFRKALLILAKDDTLDRITTDMGDHHIDPYSAVEKIISKIMPTLLIDSN
jgi:LAO/AO transport system kinase